MATDIGQMESDVLLDKAERDIIKVYGRAVKESEKKLEDYLKEFAEEDSKMLAKFEKGEITEEVYTKWRKDAMTKGKRFDEMLNTLSTDLTNSDKIAMSIVNGYTPEAYAINRNFAAFEVEKGSLIDTSFTLYDRRTVERLIKDKSIMLPKPKVDVPKDKRWNKRHIREEITQGVLQGESIPAIAKRLENVVGMDKAAALRNARTAMTGAQSLGRTDEYKRAQEMGIDLMQEWRASLDGLTRHSHRMLDGEKVNVGEVFPNGCRYPGDPEGEPSEVYNCRCYIKAFLTGFDFTDGKRLSRLGGMSYEDWKAEHEERRDKLPHTLDESYTGRDGAPKFNDYMLKNHPEIFGDLSYVEKDIENTYNRRFHLQKSVYENDPEYGIKEVDISEYLKMSWQDQNMSFPEFESYKKYILSKEAQDFAEPHSVMEGLRRYNLGATADGYGKGKGARLAFDSEYGLSKFITSNPDVHYTGETLYRGVKSSKAGIKELEKAMASGESINMRGISSWSTSKHVADEFTELSLRGTKTSTPVIFIEEGNHTRNAMPFPYSSQRGLLIQNEVVYSGDATFQVLKLEEKEGCYYAYVRENRF